MKYLRFIYCLLIIVNLSCKKNDIPDLDFRQEMRNFVENISSYARGFSPDFIVIPQNGVELITLNGESSGPLASSYVQSISGVGQEDLFYGFLSDGTATPKEVTSYLEGYLGRARTEDKVILVTDYCSIQGEMLDSYLKNKSRGYISFAADRRELDHVPAYPDPIFNKNYSPVYALEEGRNFLYLINPGSFSTKHQLLDSLRETSYDILIIDLFFDGDVQLSWEDVSSLKTKSSGANRLVICYMSIGEAENYRYYWQPGWEFANPVWLEKPNPGWPGNYVVRYWDREWQSIIYGNDNSYMKRVIDAGFDGVYLDIVDAFEYYE